MLVLPIKKKWFEMIANGEKKEEYREIKPYYEHRFVNELIRKSDNYKYRFEAEEDIFRQEYQVLFRNGYKKDSPTIICNCILGLGEGKEEWGAEPKKRYYILKILEIIEIKNWDNPNPSKVKEAMAVAALPATNPITPIEDMQEEIIKAINKQNGIGIDIGDGYSRSGQAIKNTMMFGG